MSSRVHGCEPRAASILSISLRMASVDSLAARKITLGLFLLGLPETAKLEEYAFPSASVRNFEYASSASWKPSGSCATTASCAHFCSSLFRGDSVLRKAVSTLSPPPCPAMIASKLARRSSTLDTAATSCLRAPTKSAALAASGRRAAKPGIVCATLIQSVRRFSSFAASVLGVQAPASRKAMPSALTRRSHCLGLPVPLKKKAPSTPGDCKFGPMTKGRSTQQHDRPKKLMITNLAFLLEYRWKAGCLLILESASFYGSVAAATA
mmetsp:Transcript_35592/g.82651  ORF Transcript_35592/g.82651 Transcript_35592/m.82651 type:complete len:266 (-) Transcript_35592:39-836(-)